MDFVVRNSRGGHKDTQIFSFLFCFILVWRRFVQAKTSLVVHKEVEVLLTDSP